MKRFRPFLQAVAIMALLLAGGRAALAQATLDLPLVITNNGSGPTLGRDTLRFGVNPAGTNGKDAALGEDEQPPAPPSAVFDIRWVNVGTSNNFGEGVKKNYRASTSPTQSDTFRIRLQAGDGGFPVTVSWPANLSTNFGSATLRYFDNNLGANVNVNMLTSSSTSITDDQVSTLTIYTTNPTAPASGVSVSPSPLNFGIVGYPAPGTATDSITITNTGGTAATIDSVRSSNLAFQIATPPSFPLSIAAGQSRKVGVVFTAAGVGVETSTIRVYHNQAGSPSTISASATVSSGEGLFLLNNLNTVYDNHAGVYKQIVGLKYSGAVGAQGVQFKITSASPILKITRVELGSSIPGGAGNWNFDYEIRNAASGSEALVILYGRDTTVYFNASTFDSVFCVSFDVKNIAICNAGPGGDTVRTYMYLNSIQSSLANGIGTSAGIAADPDRDSSQYNVQNSSARGDVNCDDRVDILDVLDVIDVILGRATFAPWQKNRADLAPWNNGWGTGLVFTDANNYGDNVVNVQDVTLITNGILNEKWPDNTQLYRADRRDDDNGGDATPTTGTTPSSVYDVKLTYTVRSSGINITMNNIVPVKGIQMKLKAAAPSDLKAQLLSSLGDKFTVQEKIIDGEIRLLIYSLSGDAISPSTIALLDLPFAISDLSSVVVVEPIIIGGANNEGLVVEYEVIQSTSGVDHQGVARSFNFTTSPNPIDRNGVISYTLAHNSSVTLSVVDVTGKVVAHLVNDEIQSAGQHSVDFDATGLSNGTYYCTISADGVSTSRTMVVVR